MFSADYQDDEDAIGLSRTYRVRFDKDVDVLHACDELCKSSAVESASPNYLYTAQVRPDDQFYGFQWGLPAINCESSWDIESGHPDAKIAIVDSGIDLQHDDLRGKLLAGQDFVDLRQGEFGWRFRLVGDYRFRDARPNDEDGHGSHCAGIAAAASNNGDGVAGVCWSGRVLPVRVMARVYDRVRRTETSIGSTVDIGAGINPNASFL